MQFRDLRRQYDRLSDDINNQIKKVIESSQFIGGSPVRELEEELAEYVGVKHCITCGNGTDALTLALMAWGIGKGDAVFVPDFTFFSSGECPAFEGATPIFVDVDRNTYNIDAEKLELAINQVIRERKFIPKVVVAVDLFGLPAEYAKIKPICEKYGLLLLEDGAQGFGGEIKGQKACSFGDISTTSFFPAKPLGCYGDGGAVFTNNDDWAALIKSLTVHGKNGNDKYDNIRIGMNSRLDTIQAAILQPKLKVFQEYELNEVNRIAERYRNNLQYSNLQLPVVAENYLSSWAQYTVQLPEEVNRKDLQTFLKLNGIPSMIYYAKPMHLQGAFAGTHSANAECPVTEDLCKRVLSLPMHPYLANEEVDFICNNILEYLKNES